MLQKRDAPLGSSAQRAGRTAFGFSYLLGAQDRVGWHLIRTLNGYCRACFSRRVAIPHYKSPVPLALLQVSTCIYQLINLKMYFTFLLRPSYLLISVA